MRFHLGPVPEPESAEPLPGVWTPLRHDFGPGVMQLFAIPIGGIAFVLVGWLWLDATPVMKHLGTEPGALVLELIAAIFASDHGLPLSQKINKKPEATRLRVEGNQSE